MWSAGSAWMGAGLWVIAWTPGLSAEELGMALLHGLRVARTDTLARERVEELAFRSPTARHLLQAVKKAGPHILYLRSSRELYEQRKLRGRGRFWAWEGRLIGVLEFDTLASDPRKQLGTIAHELAHALEILSERHRRLDRPLIWADGRQWPPWQPRETPFAWEVGHRVYREVGSGQLPSSFLPELPKKYGLRLPSSAEEHVARKKEEGKR